MIDLPDKVLVVEYGMITWEKWWTKNMCPSCFHEYFNKFHPQYGYDILREYEFGTCDICKRDTQKKAYYTKNLNKNKKGKSSWQTKRTNPKTRKNSKS